MIGWIVAGIRIWWWIFTLGKHCIAWMWTVAIEIPVAVHKMHRTAIARCRFATVRRWTQWAHVFNAKWPRETGKIDWFDGMRRRRRQWRCRCVVAIAITIHIIIVIIVITVIVHIVCVRMWLTHHCIHWTMLWWACAAKMKSEICNFVVFVVADAMRLCWEFRVATMRELRVAKWTYITYIGKWKLVLHSKSN